MADQIYYVAIESDTEGRRSFVFNAEDDRDAENFAKTFANEFADDGWCLAEYGLLADKLDCVMELCTF